MHEQIAVKAYYIWDEAGKPEGRDLEFWLEAEKYITHYNRILSFFQNLFEKDTTEDEYVDEPTIVMTPVYRTVTF